MTALGRTFGRFRKRVQQLRKKCGLQFTLSLSFSLAAISGMLLLMVLITNRSNLYTQAMLQTESERVVSQASDNLNLVLRNAIRISDNVYYLVLMHHELGTETIKNELKLNYESNDRDLAGIGLFSAEGQLLLSAPYYKLHAEANIAQQAWFKSALSGVKPATFSAPYIQSKYEKNSKADDWVISLSRAVQFNAEGKVGKGVLSVDLKYAQIEKIFKNIEVHGRSYLYLSDAQGGIIYHPQYPLISAGVKSENTQSNAAYDDGIHTEDYQGTKRMITVKTVSATGWKIVAVTPVIVFEERFNALWIYSLFFVLFAAFFVVLMNHVISAQIVKPIKRLEQNVLALEQGASSDFWPEPDAGPEITHLSMAIEALIKQQQQLRADILSEQKAKRRSELETLQAQINPHFLYNTLDSIIWMVENERYSGAVKMVGSLALFFRSSLARGENIITLKEELEQVQSYLSIQQVRFRNRFTYCIETEQGIEECQTVKLIVQPLVENAIIHGLDSADDEGEIKIKAYRCADQLYIEVSDNGLGMSEEQVALLLDPPAKLARTVSQGGSGIGLANVNRRIKLYFGEDYGLSIFSQADEGTMIRIHLPIRYKPQDPS